VARKYPVGEASSAEAALSLRQIGPREPVHAGASSNLENGLVVTLRGSRTSRLQVEIRLKRSLSLLTLNNAETVIGETEKRVLMLLAANEESHQHKTRAGSAKSYGTGCRSNLYAEHRPLLVVVGFII
jgi:hypothetical protein